MPSSLFKISARSQIAVDSLHKLRRRFCGGVFFCSRLLLETVHFRRFSQNFKGQSDKSKQNKRFFLIGFIISVAGIQIGKRERQILSQNAKCAAVCPLFRCTSFCAFFFGTEISYVCTVDAHTLPRAVRKTVPVSRVSTKALMSSSPLQTVSPGATAALPSKASTRLITPSQEATRLVICVLSIFFSGFSVSLTSTCAIMPS